VNSYLNDIGTVLLAGFVFQNQPKEPSPWLPAKRTVPVACPCLILYQFKCQMSLLYSSIVLSDEKYPALAMLVSIIFFHLSRFS